MAKHEPVVFLDSAGNEVSNDPVWHAQRTLREAGVGQAQDEDLPGDYDGLSGAELKALAKERGMNIAGIKKVSELRAALEAFDQNESSDDDESGDSDDDQE